MVGLNLINISKRGPWHSLDEAWTLPMMEKQLYVSSASADFCQLDIRKKFEWNVNQDKKNTEENSSQNIVFGRIFCSDQGFKMSQLSWLIYIS